MWSNRNPHTLLVGTQNSAASLGSSLTVSYEVKHTFTISPDNTSHKRNENSYSHKSLMQTFIVALFIARKWKPPKCPSTGELINKLVHLYHGTLLSNNKERTTDTCNNVGDSQMRFAN